MSQFTEDNLRRLFEAIQMRASSFKDHLFNRVLPHDNPIYLRFDIDDDLNKAHAMSLLCNEYGIRGTFFILNTAKYWDDPGLWSTLRQIQDDGHEMAWHNNILTEWIEYVGKDNLMGRMIDSKIHPIIETFRSQDITIRGSASHGDPLCRKLGYINYEVFKECPRTEEAYNFPQPTFQIPKVSMHEFGLEYEAYHVPYDLYLSESGGREWKGRMDRTSFAWRIDDESLVLLSHSKRIQILIHPQHWKI